MHEKTDFCQFSENPVFDLIKLRNVAEWPQRLRPSIMLDCGPQGSDALTAHHTRHDCTPAYACDQGIRTVCGGIITIGLVFSESAQPCRQQPPKDAQGVLCKPVTTLRRFLYYSFFLMIFVIPSKTLWVSSMDRALSSFEMIVFYLHIIFIVSNWKYFWNALELCMISTYCCFGSGSYGQLR